MQALFAHKAASQARSLQENAQHRKRGAAASGSRAFALLGDSMMVRGLNNLLAGIEVKSRSLNKVCDDFEFYFFSCLHFFSSRRLCPPFSFT